MMGLRLRNSADLVKASDVLILQAGVDSSVRSPKCILAENASEDSFVTAKDHAEDEEELVDDPHSSGIADQGFIDSKPQMDISSSHIKRVKPRRDTFSIIERLNYLERHNVRLKM